ncbi:MAG TPA: hypothetical protein VFH51_17570, partial [Myxococcota bacterium]|nr:hypothetical protein [Myxococcota bacterium]
DARAAAGTVDATLSAFRDEIETDARLTPERKRHLAGDVDAFRRVVADPRTSSTKLDRAVLNFIDDLRRG